MPYPSIFAHSSIFGNINIKKLQKKPDPNKTFFQNYSDHLDFLAYDFKTRLFTHIKLETDNPDLGDFLYFGISDMLNLKHVLMFDALRDGHDYLDEITIPPILAAASFSLFALSLVEGMKNLAIHAGWSRDDGQQHGKTAGNALLVATVLLGASFIGFLKSAISLLTRPVCTLISGWKEQNVERFYNEDSLECKVNSGLNSLINGFL